jgi:hypothetical protein
LQEQANFLEFYQIFERFDQKELTFKEQQRDVTMQIDDGNQEEQPGADTDFS